MNTTLRPEPMCVFDSVVVNETLSDYYIMYPIPEWKSDDIKKSFIKEKSAFKIDIEVNGKTVQMDSSQIVVYGDTDVSTPFAIKTINNLLNRQSAYWTFCHYDTKSRRVSETITEYSNYVKLFKWFLFLIGNPEFIVITKTYGKLNKGNRQRNS